MSKPISRREGIRLRKRVEELENIVNAQRRSWNKEWPSSENIYTLNVDLTDYTAVRVARMLGHAVVVVPEQSEGKYRLRLYGCKV